MKSANEIDLLARVTVLVALASVAVVALIQMVGGGRP